MSDVLCLLLLVVQYMTLASANVIQLELPANATLTNSSASLNGITPSREPAIPGFKLTLKYGIPYYMKAEDAYLCAIGLIYGLASDEAGWNGLIPSRHSAMSQEVNGVRVGFGSLAHTEDQNQLQYKHVIVGLLETLNALARRKRYCFTKTNLYLYGGQIGEMAIGRREPDVIAANVTIAEVDLIPNATESANPTGTGEIVDPEDPHFVINYELQQKSIPCPALLNAALNAIANSAVFDDEVRCRNFGGFSYLGEVTYTIIGVAPGTTRHYLTYLLVRKVMELLPTRLYNTNSCKEVEFDLMYNGEKLAGGSFLLSDVRDRDSVAVG